MAKNGQHQDPEEVVERALSSTEQFLEKYKNILIYGVGGVLVLVLIYFGYKKFYYEGMQDEARGQMYVAEQYFRMDSLSMALNGDGQHLGFLQIIDNYGSKAGDIVYFYAGVCQLHMGEYEAAIANLKKFRTGDEIISGRALCCIGDAYVQLGNYDEAVNYFLKAASYRDNSYTPAYLLKAGLAYEALDKKDAAMDLYQRIKNEYAETVEGRDIDKYIGRLNPEI